MKYSKKLNWTMAIGCLCSSGFFSQVEAIPLDQSNVLGQLSFSGGGNRKQEAFINQLIGMALDSSSNAKKKTYTRSANAFESLAAAEFDVRVKRGQTGITLNGTTSYLFAKYGKTSVVYYVGDLTGTYDLPASYNGHSLSGFSIFNSDELDPVVLGNVIIDKPSTPPDTGLLQDGIVNSVPDGGLTLSLLAGGIATLGVVGQCKKLRTLNY